MMHYFLLLLSILIGSSFSCKCAMRPLNEEFAQTPVVFIGRVISKVTPTTEYGNIEYTIKVEEAFKGTSVGENVIVRAREIGAACGIGVISIGDRRQIWMNEDGDTNSCTRTTSDVDRNRVELQQLAKKSS